MIVLGYVYPHPSLLKVVSAVASSVTIANVTCDDMGKSLKEMLRKLTAEFGDMVEDQPITITVAESFEGAGSIMSFDNYNDIIQHEFIHAATKAVLTKAGSCGWGIVLGSTTGEGDIRVCPETVEAATSCMRDLINKGYWTQKLLKVHIDCCS